MFTTKTEVNCIIQLEKNQNTFKKGNKNHC